MIVDSEQSTHRAAATVCKTLVILEESKNSVNVTICVNVQTLRTFWMLYMLVLKKLPLRKAELCQE